MARIITVADLREHVETDLPEAAIQRLIDEADQLVVDGYGAHGPAAQTDDKYPDVGMPLLFLERPASAVTAVTEYANASNSKLLVANDYRLEFGGQALRRLTTGTNIAAVWPWRVLVTYTISVTENPIRRGVVIDLVGLAVNAGRGVKSERAGDYSVTFADGEKQREDILGRLGGLNVHV